MFKVQQAVNEKPAKQFTLKYIGYLALIIYNVIIVSFYRRLNDLLTSK